MKFAPEWKEENIWLAYSIFRLLVVPWVFTTLTVPHLFEALESSDFRALLAARVFEAE